MVKRSLALMLLALVVLLAPIGVHTANTVGATGCAHCITDRNACQTACNGNAECLSICQSEYECCLIMCHGGSCRDSRAEMLVASNLTTSVSDEFEGTVNCQACEDNAYALWRQCVDVIGDEGDVDCRAQSDDYKVSCQNDWCH
jgi:hypothetical protein